MAKLGAWCPYLASPSSSGLFRPSGSLCPQAASSVLSAGDVGGPDSRGRALPAPSQSLVFLLWLLCHGRLNYNPFHHVLPAYLACVCVLTSSSLTASLLGTSHCCSCRRAKSALGPWDREARVPTLAGDPRVSTGLESGTPSWARQCEVQPLLASRSWVLAFGEQRRCRRGGGGGRTPEGPAVRANPCFSSSR